MTVFASVQSGLYPFNPVWEGATQAIMQQQSHFNQPRYPLPGNVRDLLDRIGNGYFMVDYLNRQGHGTTTSRFEVGQPRSTTPSVADSVNLGLAPYTRVPHYAARASVLAQTPSRHTMFFTLPSGQPLALTQYSLNPQGQAILHYMPMTLSPTVEACAQQLYTAIRNSHQPEQTKTLLGQFYWLCCHWMPYRRGNAAISDMAWRVLAVEKGLHPGSWPPAFIPDLEALTLPQTEFVTRFVQTAFVA
jgi:hypothetical protein